MAVETLAVPATMRPLLETLRLLQLLMQLPVIRLLRLHLRRRIFSILELLSLSLLRSSSLRLSLSSKCMELPPHQSLPWPQRPLPLPRPFLLLLCLPHMSSSHLLLLPHQLLRSLRLRPLNMPSRLFQLSQQHPSPLLRPSSRSPRLLLLKQFQPLCLLSLFTPSRPPRLTRGVILALCPVSRGLWIIW